MVFSRKGIGELWCFGGAEFYFEMQCFSGKNFTNCGVAVVKSFINCSV